jgi:periplasmic protein TonB
MKPEFILQADVLDILFENRNKAYGAYELRSQYDHRLKKSLAVVFSILVIAIVSGYMRNHFFHDKNITGIITVGDSVTLDLVNLRREPPPVQQPVVKKIATIKDVTIRIVPDKLVDTTTVPTNDEKAVKNIGTQNIAGDLPGDILQKPSEGNSGTGKETPPPEPEASPEILTIAENMPEFPGGLPALQRFLSRNLKTPKDDMEAGSKIRVLVRFVVDKDGSITGIDIEQSGGADFDNEVTRVMKKMPAWKPGRQNGRNVSVYFKMPVIFQAADEN